MNVYTNRGDQPATGLRGVLQRMRELGAGDRDCLWTERWVGSFLRDCQARGASVEREAGLRWLRSRKPSPGDSKLLWRWEQMKAALTTYFHLTGLAKVGSAGHETGPGRTGERVSAGGGERSPSGEAATPVRCERPGSAAGDGRAGEWSGAGAQFKGFLACKNYSARTVDCYVGWARRFYRWCRTRGVGFAEVTTERLREFLEDLAGTGVTGKTQNQALNALVSFYRHGLGLEPGEIGEYLRARTSRRLPVVLDRAEAGAVMRHLKARADRTVWMTAGLMLGAGLRQREALELRMKDIDVERGTITVRQGKGDQDRVTMLPVTVRRELGEWIAARRRQYEEDLAAGAGYVPLPGGLARKKPAAARSWAWQYFLPGQNLIEEKETGRRIRWHVHENTVGRVLGEAARRVGVLRAVTCHSLRHTFATMALENGTDIRTLQELLGHQDVKTTMIYTHVLNRPGVATPSPLDALAA